MQLSALQIVLLVLVAAEINVDRRGLSLTHARPVIVGFLCGLILGDMNSGLYIGGTFTLMSLGVAALGGSSVPDYGVATIIACAFAKTTGQGPEVGMTIGLPVGMLGVQMDVLYKICNSFIAQKSQKYANEKQFGKMYAILYLCPVMVAVFMAFPTAVALTAGAPLVQAILDVLPSWVTGGLSATVVTAKTPLAFQMGEVNLAVADLLDKIMPSMISVATVLVLYKLLGKKGMKITTLILIVIIFSMICSALGILA